jgi:hypothetical protein
LSCSSGLTCSNLPLDISVPARVVCNCALTPGVPSLTLTPSVLPAEDYQVRLRKGVTGPTRYYSSSFFLLPQFRQLIDLIPPPIQLLRSKSRHVMLCKSNFRCIAISRRRLIRSWVCRVPRFFGVSATYPVQSYNHHAENGEAAYHASHYSPDICGTLVPGIGGTDGGGDGTGGG